MMLITSASLGFVSTLERHWFNFLANSFFFWRAQGADCQGEKPM